MIGVVFFILITIYAVFGYSKRQKNVAGFKMPDNTRALLLDNVSFYENLNEEQRLEFENRIADFLQQITITGVGTTVEPIDQILIASGAIILLFPFKGWRYENISEVLLYKDSFNEAYSMEGKDRNILGMVGDGALNGQMILSKTSVRASFKKEADGHNTVLHEFAHLLDKADGATDGIPEYLLSRPYVLPWINIMHKTIQEMKHNRSRDINFYGTTNDAEFFAVVTEYFFERPAELKEHHPQLYLLFEQMFTAY